MKKTYKSALIIALLVFANAVSAKADDTFITSAKCSPEKGWMASGWGVLQYSYFNSGANAAIVKSINATWYVGSDSIDSWQENRSTTVASNTSADFSMVAWMPTDVVNASKQQDDVAPYIKGYCLVQKDNDVVKEPFTIQVPIATLEFPAIVKKAKYVALDLETTTWDLLDNEDLMLSMLNDTYKAMYDLTGNRPYDKAVVVFKECPENPYFAYAGNPIVMNEKFVETSAKRMDRGEFDFGWIHELGHDFDDVIGHWYNFGTFTEFMANIKLSYTYEALVTNKSKYKVESWVTKGTFVDGKFFNEEYFIPYGEKYLKSDRSWETLKSDEYHAMFYTVVQEYGWKSLKKFFRTYGKLSKTDMKAPSSDIERLELICAVLQNSTPETIMPLFQQYRLPISDDKIARVNAQYKLK